MRTANELECDILMLSLDEREALLSVIEQSISHDYDRLAEAGLADDMAKMERILRKHGVMIGSQTAPWEHLRDEILAEFRSE